MNTLWNFIGRLVVAAMFDVLDPFLSRFDAHYANAINTEDDE